MTVTYGNIILGKTCIMCGYKLTQSFPEGFPDDWKFCCYCNSYAHNIAGGRRGVIEGFFRKGNVGDFMIIKLAELLDKIEKKITLVG